MKKEVIISYLQSLLATALTAALAIGKSPIDFSKADLKIIVNSVWVAFIPVLIRALSKNDTAFGVGSNTANVQHHSVKSN